MKPAGAERPTTPDAASQRTTGAGLASALGRLVPLTLFGLIPLVWLGALVVHQSFLESTNLPDYFDFHTFWSAGRAVLDGRSAYPPANTSVLAHERSFVYPAPAALVMVPFALLPFAVSATIFALLLIVSLPVALRIVGVRDWRCYGIAMVSGPLFLAVTLDAISPLLVIPLALVWRYRDRRLVAASALAAAVMLKVFLWPLLLWFALTRRARTAFDAAVLIIGSTLAAWAVLEFRGFLDYPHILVLLSDLLDGKGYSLVALGRSLGLAVTASRALPWIVGAAILGVIALQGRRNGTDRQTFILAVAAAFALSPIIWLHYFVLLYIPIAIVAPRLAPLWVLPLALFVFPGQSIEPFLWRPKPKQIDEALTPRVGHPSIIIGALIVVLVVFVLSLLAPASVTRQEKQSAVLE